jgi:2-haloacid dehalogenase
MLAAAVEAAGIAEYLDAVLSVDTLRRYKPLPGVYALATDAFVMQRSDVGFVSSNRWDVMGAASFGFQAYWVNRAGMPDEYPDFPPLRRIGDLAALPAA